MPLALNAGLNGLIIARHGIRGDEPPLLVGLIYAALAMAACAGWTDAPLAALVVTAVGGLGRALNFRKLTRETTVEKIILAVGASVIVAAGLRLL